MRKYITILIALLLLSGCTKDSYKAVFGGPANATIVIENSSSTKATVDEENLIHSIRIYVFKNSTTESESNEMVGYGYFDDLTGEGPYYCPMELTASGNLDFYVIANDEYANITSGSLTSTSTRAEIEAVRFDGLISSTSTMAVPMSNIQDGDVVDSNNFTYSVAEDAGIQIIPVTVTRAMSRLSLHFAKTSGTTSQVTIDKAVLNGIGSTVTLFPPGDSQVYGSTAVEDVFLSTAEEVTLTNDTGSLATDDLQAITAEAYMLPNPYGSTSADAYVADTSASDYATYGETRRYTLDLTYSIGGTQYTKTVYLPTVEPNNHILVKGIFKNSVEVAMTVTILSWTEYSMEVSFD